MKATPYVTKYKTCNISAENNSDLFNYVSIKKF